MVLTGLRSLGQAARAVARLSAAWAAAILSVLAAWAAAPLPSATAAADLPPTAMRCTLNVTTPRFRLPARPVDGSFADGRFSLAAIPRTNVLLAVLTDDVPAPGAAADCAAGFGAHVVAAANNAPPARADAVMCADPLAVLLPARPAATHVPADFAPIACGAGHRAAAWALVAALAGTALLVPRILP